MPTRADHLRALPGGADLERLLAQAETDEAAESSAAAAPAAATPAAATPAVATPAAATPAAATPAAVSSSAAVAPRRAADPLPLALAPPSLAAGRYRLDPALKSSLPARQALWIAWSSLVLAVGSATGLAASRPALLIALALGAGAWAARPQRLLLGPAVAAATVGVALLVGLLIAPQASPLVLSGSQVLAAGAVAGLGAGLMDRAEADPWRRLQATLGGAAGAGLGWWAATTIVGPPGDVPLTGALQGLTLGLLGSQALLASAMEWRSTDRMPPPARIRATLAEAYRPPCLRAWQLDAAFEKQAPDPETRDGLGEVAAWVYRLQWTLMSLDREIAALEGEGLERRQVELEARAAASADEFTRERLQATARHLAQLVAHRDTLVLERERSSALSEYASAYLEEARAGLALARVQPGEQVPDRLGDVLSRLRTHAAAGDARRRTAREVGSLG